MQTDNGTEFTNRLTTWRDKKTLFEEELEKLGISAFVLRKIKYRLSNEYVI